MTNILLLIALFAFILFIILFIIEFQENIKLKKELSKIQQRCDEKIEELINERRDLQFLAHKNISSKQSLANSKKSIKHHITISNTLDVSNLQSSVIFNDVESVSFEVLITKENKVMLMKSLYMLLDVIDLKL